MSEKAREGRGGRNGSVSDLKFKLRRAEVVAKIKRGMG